MIITKLYRVSLPSSRTSPRTSSLSLGRVMVEFMHRRSACVWSQEVPVSTSRWDASCLILVVRMKSSSNVMHASLRDFKYPYNLFLDVLVFSGLGSGEWSQQLCSQWPVFDLFWLLPRPLWRRVSSSLYDLFSVLWGNLIADLLNRLGNNSVHRSIDYIDS